MSFIYFGKYGYLDIEKIASSISGDSKLMLEEISDMLHKREASGKDISDGLDAIWELITHILDLTKNK